MLKKPNSSKIIFHIDMNAFFCSVASVLNPSLRGIPFAIGREGSYKGVISTCSYEARALGIHSAMPLTDAFKILPNLLVIHLDYSNYQVFHNRFLEIIKGYSNSIEVGSIDEVYVDMTESSKTTHPLVLAHQIQNRILKEVGLPCSIGIGPTLYLAKMASDMKKPLGITVLRKRDVKEKLYPNSVKDIFGIGKKTYPKLIDNNINTIGEFMDINNRELVISLIGENMYNYAYNSILGKSTSIVDPNRHSESSSISTSSTFDIFKTSEAEILYEIRKMVREVYYKMINDGYYCKTVVLTLRDSSFNTISRRKTLDDFTDDLYTINDIAQDLVEEYYDSTKEYRLVGIGVSNLISKNDLPKEYNLFTITSISEREQNINNLVLDFQKKFGKNIISWKDKNEK